MCKITRKHTGNNQQENPHMAHMSGKYYFFYVHHLLGYFFHLKLLTSAHTECQEHGLQLGPKHCNLMQFYSEMTKF